MNIRIPEFSLVLVIGSPACGSTDFIQQHFRADEILPDNSHDMTDTLKQRLSAMQLTVIDVTDTDEERLRVIMQMARRTYTQVVTIDFDLPRYDCSGQTHPFVSSTKLEQIRTQMRRERADATYLFTSADQIADSVVVREKLSPDHRHRTGPFDIIGDVHGCYDELVELLGQLGYSVTERQDQKQIDVTPPQGRTLVFVGDLVDRGPKIAEVLLLAMGMVSAGTALCVPGNHDDKLMRALKGRKVKIAHGLAESLDQIKRMPDDFRWNVRDFFTSLPSHLVLDNGALVIAHAGLRQFMHGRNNESVRDFALYGATTGKLDQYGLPVRLEWAKDYHGAAKVIYGHTPIPRHSWINNTLNIDTGCVFGGALSALRYPELTLHSVRAKREYAVSARPFLLELDADLDDVK